MDLQDIIFQFIGGLGIFLFGIKYMGEGLQNSAGDRLREILDKLTTNPFMGVLAGIFVTVLIQSSSGTTVLTVGLVNAGFLTLRQAIGIIMGANIGTTITSFIIGIDVGGYALPIMAVGSIFIFFFKNLKWIYVGQIIFGFGALFLGLDLMGQGMKPLSDFRTFQDLTVSMSDNPILGVIVGTIFTGVVQSSSATIGILQELYAQNMIDLKAALPVLFGDNIGTTVTAVLAAIGTTIAARRAALTHVIFNLIGTLIFIIFLEPFRKYIEFLALKLHLQPAMQIAFAHGTFNITNVLIQFWFIGFLAMLVTKIIKGEDQLIEHKPKHLDEIILETSPVMAIRQAKLEILRMANYAETGLKEAIQYLNVKEKKNAELALQYEEAINNLDRQITSYLIKLSVHPLTKQESNEHSMLLDASRDIERIGDHMENIIELVDYQLRNNVRLTEIANNEINEMFDLTLMTLMRAITALEKNNIELAQEVLGLEDKIDKMERTLRKQHILRMNEGACDGNAGIVFVDIISNLERIGDHAVNIAEAVLEK
ncbi:Na/Pi cotransporter family protein [Bacillus sp. NEB1478]|uniref:Na/Pi cotransporter family protein n=1 Tax=Bacillus sp. NEB1478 TaxID=3073816 RepID=UPI0028738CBE|nr:Na/Pi cotransporter family protein [Bacillus sp. NEB1478]WNB93519.1 Na/Pi cotransporter family protein [Bacillus sp. NEB1478]